MFVAKGYVVTVDGNICEPSANGREAIDEYYGEVNATLIPAAAQVFKGSFTGVVTGEGYKKVVGKIEFVQSVESHGPPERKAQASVSTVAKLADIEYLTHEELNLLKSGFMRVTLIEKEYY